MPTTRRRYQVTETDEVARALDEAERRWPGEPRSRLIVRLIVQGGERAAEVSEAVITRRLAALEEAAALGIHYPHGYREALRDEWPA